MPMLSAFSFPFPETRFFKAGSLIYKFKIRGGSSYSGEEVMEGNCFNQELEEIVRTVLGNLDSLQPFSSSHFNVFPYKKLWEGGSQAVCKQSGDNLRAYPSIIFLYLEKNMEKGTTAEEKLSSDEDAVSEPQTKRYKTDSPLEEAILKDLIHEFENERKICSTGQRLYNLSIRGEAKGEPGHVDKEGAKDAIVPQQESGLNTIRGNGTPDMRQEEEDEEEEEISDSKGGSPVKPGILTRLAR
ncbi:membrane-anchored junction protein isoform X2 [Notolabrus celidotus]|uniref:membrane-anchored junction protein isoform X2 n=1 Tax=Notolabrus celidotus TaxID=1203425 RepID=UPI00148F6087|nr:membrane-anchored junction protein isoform X2 [Notolabrus celidotus]